MDICRKKLLYRSVKRGCRETELLLTNFATNNLENMSSEELVQYEKLLDMSDHDLYNCFMSIDFVDLEQGLLVKKIIAFNKELI